MVAMLLGCLFFAPAAVASDDEPDETDMDGDEDEREEEEGEDKEATEKEEWEQEEREVEVEVDDESFRIESRRDSDRGQDTLRADFDLDEGRLEFQFEGRDGKTKLRLDEWVLLEFQDENVDGSFQAGEPVLQRVSPEDVVATQLVLTDLGAVRRINATYGLGDSGTWTLSFLIPSRPFDADGVRIAPTEVKFDVAIDRFPYRESSSAVALQFRFQAESEVEEGEKGGVPGLFSTVGGVRGFLRWVNHSTVDGSVRPVGVQAMETKFDSDLDEFEGEALVTFSYARGTSILHDPSVGVTIAKAAALVGGPMGQWGLATLGIALSVVLVAATLGPRFRYRG